MLGSTRLVTGDKPPNWPSSTASILECYDYVPFGRMLNSGDSLRNTGCYPSNPDYELASRLPQKFTGKERDAETRLDYFEARYFSAAQGRFLSADPFSPIDELIGQEFDDYLANPQYWNKYAYSLNNPLKYKDSDGHLPHAIMGGLIGGGIGFALELYSQHRSGQDINWAKVATKTGAGAAIGATAAATFGATLFVQGGSLAVVAASSGMADRALDRDASTQALDSSAVLTDAAVGAVAGAVGGVIGRNVQTAIKNSAGQKLNERIADHVVRSNAQRDAAHRAAAAEAERRVLEHPDKIGRLAAGTSRAAAKTGATVAAQKAVEALRKRREEEELQR